MRPNKTFALLFVSVSLLTGCALTPRPALPEAKYEEFAKYHVGLSKCGTSGHMDLETASLGLSYLKGAIDRYSYDSARMDRAVQNTASLSGTSSGPSKAECNTAAMEILAAKRQIGMNNQQVAAERQELQNVINNRPRQTYCNQIGTQTMCQSY